MNIQVLTFHACNNNGALFQAYALSQTLKELGHHCKFLNYQPEWLYKKPAVPHSPNTLALWLDFYWDTANFQKFRSKYFVQTPKCKDNFELQKCSENADGFIVGSDQVFNPDIIASSGQLDENFLLSFTNKPKAAYAASFGNSELPTQYNETYRHNLKTFRAIGIREASGTAIVRNQLGISGIVECVIDPTLLYSGWDQILPKGKSGGAGTLFWLFQNSEIQKISMTLKKRGIIPKTEKHFASFLNYLHGKFYEPTPSPLRWMQAIRQSDFVITDSFHCMVFSIIFHRPFLVFPLTSWGNDWTERMRSLLQKLELENRILIEPVTEEQIDKLAIPINWEKVDFLCSQWRKCSKKFLEKSCLLLQK